MADLQSITMPAGDISIIPAQPSDIDTIQGIYDEIAHWLLSRGIRQWLPEDFSRQRTLVSIERGQLFLARQGETPVGMVTLQWTDLLIWGDVAVDAGYVHGLGVRRAFASKDIGGALLWWAGEMALAEGKDYLRLDCWSDNFALCRYYERAGFTFKRFKVFQGKTHEWRASLYEKKLTEHS
jgi:ribosomal protein S18 acetylase RimI-like enzyme